MLRIRSMRSAYFIDSCLACTVTLLMLPSFANGIEQVNAPKSSSLAVPPPAKNSVRVATFNVALNRKKQDQLVSDLEQGDKQSKRIASIVQLVSPDVLLLNEVDYSEGKSAKILLERYLNLPQVPSVVSQPSPYLDHFTGPVNTGVPSGLDLNLNGRTSDPDDGWGFGAFPGQYGMVVYSRHRIDTSAIRTFQMLKWSSMPGALRPMFPSDGKGPSKPYHQDDVWAQLRLSSKSHWDVPIRVGDKVIHILASHPTPPVFDGPEDRNGCRNHDEIRLLKDYIEGGSQSSYIVDDNGKAGGLEANAHFVILGDLNSDPIDGSGLSKGIVDLIGSQRVSQTAVPASEGSVEASQKQGKSNLKQKGNPKHDTADFNDEVVGNLRVDFVLPSSNCLVVASGVYWPTQEQLKDIDPDLVDASDHHLVWVDIEI
jgi:endonuclease/exonuclease/phosphatase family metal-dependent hydrolase